MSVYDPVFAEQDLRLLTLLGLTALPENRVRRLSSHPLPSAKGLLRPCATCLTARALTCSLDPSLWLLSRRAAQQASYGLRSPTIVFMPHCDLHLYENLLRENWTRARLPHVLLIANRLREYAERCVPRPSHLPHIPPRPPPLPFRFRQQPFPFLRACLPWPRR